MRGWRCKPVPPVKYQKRPATPAGFFYTHKLRRTKV
nr:MAG TPA: hypothetical protein [Caudoviricetes sp.]